MSGQKRTAAASDRLDKAVEELGQQHKTDVPQGEKLEVVQHQPTEQVIPQFLPILQSRSASNEAQPSVRLDPSERFHESRKVPPPIEEPGVDTDLKELMARDERLEIEETNREVMAVLHSLGADTAKYRGKSDSKVLNRQWRSIPQSTILKRMGVPNWAWNFRKGTFEQFDRVLSRGLGIGSQCVTR